MTPAFRPLIAAVGLGALLSLPLAGCGNSANNDHDTETEAGESSAGLAALAPPAEPQLVDGIQELHVNVGGSFEPYAIRLAAGIPARLILTRTTDDTCVKEIKAPELGIEPTELPLNESVALEFTPDVSGEFAFTCGMDMESGSLVVTT